MKNFYSLIILLLFVSANCQIINFPDPAFKNALVNTICVYNEMGDIYIGDADTNNDGEIEVAEAMFVQSLGVSNAGITSLEGIENFQNLYSLACAYNSLTSLNLVGFPNLSGLNCQNNLLTTLDLTGLTSVDEFHCENNQLTELIIGNTQIGYLYCDSNQLESIDLTNNNVFALFLTNNPFTQLVLPDIQLHTLQIIGTQITSLNLNCSISGELTIAGNPNLTYINANNNHYEMSDSSFNLNVDNNPNLQYVCCDDYQWWWFEPEDAGYGEFDSWSNATSSNVTVSTFCNPSPTGNMLSGNITLDCGGINANAENVQVNITQGTLSGSTYTNNAGIYFFSASMGMITVTPELNPAYFTITPPTFSYDATTIGNLIAADFCLSPNGIHNDVEISIVELEPARPGFDAFYRIVCRNVGTETSSGIVTVTYDEAILDYVSSTSGVSVTAGTLSWSYTDLPPLETITFFYRLNVNSPTETPPVNIADVLAFNASSTTLATDETPSNNSFQFEQTVVGAYDPNDKSVQQPQINVTQLDEYLYYTIRFQNTGTYDADVVRIEDILEDTLQPDTWEVISASHPYRATLTEGNKLEFFFEGIHLPAVGDNEPGSHGFIAFRIKPAASVGLGDVIENTANIYFDFNFPIVTNTVSTTVTALETEDFTLNDNFSIYPNPVSSLFTIQMRDNSSAESISIYNMIGQIVKSIPVGDGNSTQHDVSALSAGTYFIKVVSANGETSKKLIKL